MPHELEWKAAVEGENETHDVLLGDYQEIGGLNVATKITERRNGKVHYEYEVSDFRLMDQIDEKPPNAA